MCSSLEKNPEIHIRNVIAVLTDSTIDDALVDLKMSAGVYLKNYTVELLKNIFADPENLADESKRVYKGQLSFLI